MVAWPRPLGLGLPRRCQVWRRHLRAGVPEYLARHYWWAYLTRNAVRLFDHPPVINAILFGQYRRLLQAARELLGGEACGRFLHLTCVYGELIPTLYRTLEMTTYHLTDIAPVQLEAAARKLARESPRVPFCPVRANVEALPYASNAFDTLLIFFLLHEMPPEARANTLREACRVLRPGGRLVVVEYGALTPHHWLHRIAPLRWLIEFLEPFLGGFWRSGLDQDLQDAAKMDGKSLVPRQRQLLFGGFYRACAWGVSRCPPPE